MKKHKIVVGQEIFFRRLADREGDDTSLYKGKVIKVGRKYIEITGHRLHPSARFDMEDMYARYTTTGHQWAKCYLTEQDYLDEQEYDTLKASIKNTFAYYSFPKLTLDQLRRISAILDEPKL